MKLVTVFPKRMIVPDGDPCDRCPRTLGQGGRYVRVTSDGLVRTYQLCSKCVTEVKRSADHVVVGA